MKLKIEKMDGKRYLINRRLERAKVTAAHVVLSKPMQPKKRMN